MIKYLALTVVLLTACTPEKPQTSAPVHFTVHEK